MLTVSVKDIKNLVGLYLGLLTNKRIKALEIKGDYYWNAEHEGVYDIAQQPLITIGVIVDDWE